ncbi:MAG: magnesium transporter [Verrucomicrobiales bacterium]
MSALHEADTAEFTKSWTTEPRSGPNCCGTWSDETKAEMVEYLPLPVAEEVLDALPADRRKAVLELLPDDFAVDLFQDVDEQKRLSYLHLLSKSRQALTRRLLQYPEDTAGGRMTTSLATVHEGMTIREAIASLDSQSEDAEILSRIFVVDDQHRFVGKVRLRDLTFNKRSRRISEIIDDELIAIRADADQEEAAQMIAKYDLVALPVIDADNKLLGIITHDDALEIVEEESTEDFERSAAIAGETPEEGYLDTPAWMHLRRRFPWVLGLALLGIISGYVILHYESTLKADFILALYLPMIVAAGGNTGGQAATMVIRAMALGEFQLSDFAKVMRKEFAVGVMLGVGLGACIFLQVRFGLITPPGFGRPDLSELLHISGVVALSLAAQITCSTMVGAGLPMLARLTKIDPAVVASPAITTLVDVLGLVIYFTIATHLM